MLGIAGALIGSQAPGYTLQYMQALQGSVDSYQAVVDEGDANVAQSGHTRETALAECRDGSTLLRAYCESHETAARRLAALKAHLAALEAANDYVRPLMLARAFDRAIAESVAKQFEPALPATPHGAVYAAGGFAVFWGLSAFFFGLIGALFGGGRRRYA
jgi:hypothetical protein